MLLARAFLAVTSLLYIGLGIWCTVAPATTSQKVGFERIGEAGRSEFVTVYGGLEVGLGLVFAAFAWKPKTVGYGLLACLLIHGALVAFRTGSFLHYDAMRGMVLQLAIGEWLIFLTSLGLYWFTSASAGEPT